MMALTPVVRRPTAKEASKSKMSAAQNQPSNFAAAASRPEAATHHPRAPTNPQPGGDRASARCHRVNHPGHAVADRGRRCRLTLREAEPRAPRAEAVRAQRGAPPAEESTAEAPAAARPRPAATAAPAISRPRGSAAGARAGCRAEPRDEPAARSDCLRCRAPSRRTAARGPDHSRSRAAAARAGPRSASARRGRAAERSRETVPRPARLPATEAHPRPFNQRADRRTGGSSPCSRVTWRRGSNSKGTRE